MTQRYDALRRMKLFLGILLISSLTSVGIAQAQIVVDTTDDELINDGDCSLREAIEAANTDAAVDGCSAGSGTDTITLPAGTYTLTLVGTGDDANATGDLDITTNMTINGGGADNTTVDGNASDRVFHVQGGASVTINDVEITNGNATDAPNTTLDGTGGGIYNDQSSVTLNRCVVRGNEATGTSDGARGAGVSSIGSSASLTITQSEVSNNTTKSSTGFGAGVYAANTGSATIRNSTISGNTTGISGAGLFADDGVTMDVISSTVAFNSSGGVGALVSATVNLKSTIVSDHTGSDCANTSATFNSNDYNIDSDDTCELDGANDQVSTDPLLAALADNGGNTRTHLLQIDPDSPAIDQGSCGALTEDQRELPRIVDDSDTADADDGCDVGAVELTPQELPVELIAFNALSEGADVLLQWSTASETNNAGFEVQHKRETTYEAVTFVDGRGTTNEVQDYSARITDLAPGRHTFRLKQVDFDGAFEYSPEVEVTLEVPEGVHLSSAYPNPFNPRTQFTLTVSQAQQVKVTVYDVLGREVALLHDGVVEADVRHTFTFEASDLPSGTYLYRVVGERFVEARQMMLLK